MTDKGKQTVKAAKNSTKRGGNKKGARQQSRIGDRFQNSRPAHDFVLEEEKTPAYKRRFQNRRPS